VRLAEHMGAEFWTVSSRTGDGVSELFCRMAALAFDGSVCREKEASGNTMTVGSDLVSKLKFTFHSVLIFRSEVERSFYL
jgi:hypothetical protein